MEPKNYDEEAVKRKGLYRDEPGPELLNDTLKVLFREYSRIEKEDILPHILNIRQKAWSIHPWPCIGLFLFCKLSLSTHPAYPRVLASLKKKNPSREENDNDPTTLLDLGCCFGQDIRKLVFDGAAPENLVACDLKPEFLDLGYELFRDRGKLTTAMIAADLFQDGDDGPLKDREGAMDIVHASLFLHLFTWDGQVEACKRIIKLLKPRAGSLVLGKQTGNLRAGERELPGVGRAWRHDAESFREMWRGVGEGMGIQLDVWVEVEEMRGEHQEEGVCWVTFEVRRL